MAVGWIRADRARVSVIEALGLRPLLPGLRQCVAALGGDAWSEPGVADTSSLALLVPRLSLPLWAGMARADHRVPVTNLPNRTPPPHDGPYHVTRRQVCDFRGGTLTYDSHEGTDFAVAPGTRLCTVAPGVVSEVRRFMQRGGLKVVVDHGGGLVSVYAHCARAEVAVGERVSRGQVIARSGMAGVDGILFFPWLAPHLHLTVLLDGEAVDPWAAPGEVSLWRTGDNAPTPWGDGASDEAPGPDTWDHEAVQDTVDACLDPELAAWMASLPQACRAGSVAAARTYFPTRFSRLPPIVTRATARSPRLDLPLHPDDHQGVVFLDGLEAP